MITRVQWKPNLILPERRLCLTRIIGERGNVGDGKGYGWKFSLSLCLAWRFLFIGLYVKKEYDGRIFWLCLLPCLAIRVHYHRSYGGRFA